MRQQPKTRRKDATSHAAAHFAARGLLDRLFFNILVCIARLSLLPNLMQMRLGDDNAEITEPYG